MKPRCQPAASGFVRDAPSLLAVLVQVQSEEDGDVFDSSKGSVELVCVHAREKLTNSVRLQWRKLKSHVERLDSQGITFELAARTREQTRAVAKAVTSCLVQRLWPAPMSFPGRPTKTRWTS